MREPVCSVIYPLRHGAENRKGRLIESSPNPSPNKLNKVRGLDEIVPLTVGPAVSALEAITSWLCFCDPASGLWKTAGSQLLLPVLAGELGDALSGTGSGGVDSDILCMPPKLFIFCYFGVIWASMNLSEEGMIQ